MSFTSAIRSRKNALLDMTNMDLAEDGIPITRPGTIRYGIQPLGQVIGMGTFNRSLVGSTLDNWMISMQVIDGVGKVCIRKDAGSWTVIGGSYSPTAWAKFTKQGNRVYISNKVNKMSYYDITTGNIVVYTEISAPSAPTVTATGLSGTVATYRIRVSANNKVGETNASTATTVTVSEVRDSWDPTTQYLTITATTVTGADSYNFYIGTVAGEEHYLGNVTKPASGTTVTFVDNNRAALNVFKKAPEGNSTGGPILGTLIATDSRLYGIEDADNPYREWYSASGDNAGNFSPYDGGGWVDINKGGDSIPISIVPFRTGKGDSAVTILTRGSAGAGDLYHQGFETQTLGDYSITYPVIIRANGQSGTYSSMAVVEVNNSLEYPTGRSFKTTGTKAQMVNILVTNNITDTIVDDVERLNLKAMHKAVGLNNNGRVFWCLPVGSDSNSEIWIHDVTRRGAWILRWTIAADYMWLYEDSDGVTHHCVLVSNKILEFSETALDDDGVPFRTRLAGSMFTFDESGLQMAAIDMMRFYFLNPRGSINVGSYGLAEGSENVATLSTERVEALVRPTTWSRYGFSRLPFSFKVGAVESVAQAQKAANLEIDETISQLSFDITTDSRSRYALHSVKIEGKIIPGLYQGED